LNHVLCFAEFAERVDPEPFPSLSSERVDRTQGLKAVVLAPGRVTDDE